MSRSDEKYIYRTRNAWRAMKKRCLNTDLPDFKNWGGRGIKVCDRWVNSYENFLADMGECPSDRSLDRIDNDGNYEPGNCRWATRIEQARNSRWCHYVEYKGQKKTITEWCEIIGITNVAFHRRLKRNLPIDDLFKKQKTYRKKRGLKRPIKDMPCVCREGLWYAL